MAQRLRRFRRRPRLDVDPHDAAAGRICVDRRLGAVHRCERRSPARSASRPEGGESVALRPAVPSRRQLFLRHVLAGRARRSPAGPSAVWGLRPQRVIAIGESQSAARLVTYIDAIHPLAHVYDGFLVHSRGGGAAPLSAPQPTFDGPPLALIRDDIEVPVLTFQTETDVVAIGFFAARQPDGPSVQTWEVAGTAHVDTYMMVVGPTDQGPSARDTTHLPPVQSILGGTVACDLPINSGPQHYVLAAALRQL